MGERGGQPPPPPPGAAGLAAAAAGREGGGEGGLAVTLSPGREVAITFGPGALSPERLPSAPAPIAVLLDGEMAGLVALVPRGEGGAALRFRLPGHRLARFLELRDPATGASLLPTPLPLGGFYRLSWRRLSREGRVIAGAFQLAVPLDPVLHLAFSADDAVLAEGFAAARPNAPGVYAFRLPITRLPRPGPPQPLALRLASCPVPLPFGGLAFGPEALGLAGVVEAVTAEGVRGWAVDFSAPERPLTVELRRDGRVAARARADAPRPDLAALGVAGAVGGFFLEAALAPRPLGMAPERLDVVLAETGIALAGSPVIREGGAGLLGHFDALEEGVASGWARDAAAPHRPVLVQIACQGTVVAEGLADLPRPDVAEAGFGPARAGFRLRLPLSRALRERAEITAHPAAAQEITLPGSPRRERPNPLRAAFEAHLAKPPSGPCRARLEARLARRLAAAKAPLAGGLSLLMPLRDPRPDWLEEALGALTTQLLPAGMGFELLILDDGSRDPVVAELLARAAAHLPPPLSFRHVRSESPRGLAATLAAGLEAASQPWVMVMEHDDALPWDGIAQLLAAAAESGADLVLADGLVFGADPARPEGLAFQYGAALETLLEAAASGDLLTPLPFLIEAGLARRAASILAETGEGAEFPAWLAAARRLAERPVLLARPVYAHRRHHLGRRLALGGRAEEAVRALAARLGPAEGVERRGPVRLALLPGEGEKAAPEETEGTAAAFARALGVPVHAAALTQDPGAWSAALAGEEPFVLFLAPSVAPPRADGALSGLWAALGAAGAAAAAPLLAGPEGRVAASGLVLAAGGFVPACAGDEVWLGEGVRNPGPYGLLRLPREAAGLPGLALLFRREVLAAACAAHPPQRLAQELAAAAPGLTPAAISELLPAAWALACREAGGRLIAVPDLLALTAPSPSLTRAALAPLGALFPALIARGDPFYRPYFDAEGRYALGAEAAACRAPLTLALGPHPATAAAQGAGRRARAPALRVRRRGY